MDFPDLLGKSNKRLKIGGIIVAVIVVGLFATNEELQSITGLLNETYRITAEIPEELRGQRIDFLVYDPSSHIIHETTDISDGIGYLKGEYGNSISALFALNGIHGDSYATFTVGESSWAAVGLRSFTILVERPTGW